MLSLFLYSLRRNVGSLSDAKRKVMTFLILNTGHGFELLEERRWVGGYPLIHCQAAP